MKILAFACLILSQVFSVAVAGEWPERPIKLTVAYGAGGTTDSTARLLSKFLEEELGQNVTVLNKPGGGGSVAATLAKTQRPDGYNVFTFVTGAAVIAPHTQKLPYDPVSDFTPIARYASWNLGIVVPKDAPFSTLEGLIAHAKKNPGKLTYGISGSSTPQHLAMEMLASAAGIKWKAIPYKGGAAAVTALLGGHIDMMAGATEWMPQVRSGDFKLIAILTEKRMKQFPEVPTLVELGYDIVAASMLGVAGPKGISKSAVNKLDAAIKKAIQKPEFIELIDRLAMQVSYLDSDGFGNLVKEQYRIQGEVIKKAGLAAK